LCITCMSFFNSSVILSDNILLDPYNYFCWMYHVYSSTESKELFGLLQSIARSSNLFLIATSRAEKVRNLSMQRGHTTLVSRH
jgi:hypothetical protein